MAREVLSAAQHAATGQAPLEGSGQGAGGGGLLTPGPHVDHRVGRVVVDVADRAEHPVQAAAPGLVCGAVAVAFRQGDGLFWVDLVQSP